jgi:hypothetical protein
LRWILAKSGRAHLDLGERSERRPSVPKDHVLVTACRVNIDVNSVETSLNEDKICFNCLRVFESLRAGPSADKPT